MLFDVTRFVQRVWCTAIIVLLVMGFLLSCSDENLNEDDASDDFTQRVEDNLLPEITDESQDMLRNLLNFMPVFTEICATPFAALGSFTSMLPGLQQAQQSGEYSIQWIDDSNDDDNKTWKIKWQNVVFGAQNATSTIAPVNIKLTARYFDRNLSTLQPIPFNLTPNSTPQTGGTPDSFAAQGYYLFQDLSTGQWTLRWHATQPMTAFSGTLSDTEFRRVMLQAEDTAEPDDLEVNDDTREVTFEDTASPGEDKGFTFYATPGSRIRFQLSLNSADITSNQLRLGGMSQPLPSTLNPSDFKLSSSLPIQPTGKPTFTPGVDQGTFIWQDDQVDNDQCMGTEDEWHIRFSAPDTTKFHGSVKGQTDDAATTVVRVVAVVGPCSAPNFDGSQKFDYTCTPDATDSGYDLCVTQGQRVQFEPKVNDVKDPSLVFIGATQDAPPSASPFDILFEFDIKEQDSARNLKIEDTSLVLRGNRDQDQVNVERSELINPDQLSLDPNCVLLQSNGENVLPAVRVTGSGQYSTNRFQGSRFELKSTDPDDNVSLSEVDFAFEEVAENDLQTVGRFPDRGSVRLRTRLDNPSEDVKVTAVMTDITAADGNVTSLINVVMIVDNVSFHFNDQPIDLGAESE